MAGGTLQRLGCALLLLQLVSATPSLWVSLHLNPQGNGQTNPPGLTCIDHPAAKYGSHNAPTGLTSAITFTLTDAGGSTVTSICPEQPYTLKVDLGSNAGHMFLTTTAGSLVLAGTTAVDTCGSGSRIATADAATLWTQTLTVTCAQLASSTSINVRATHATGQSNAFETNSAAFAVDPTCFSTTCSNPSSSPSPAPSPSPTPGNSPSPSPAPRPSPSPSPRPVYPTCIGAALLANPCPLGKRCFYDTECKPQMEDLVAPNCGNAAPLSNPWPAGKCCYYDSQCKQQCDDLKSTACGSLKIPPCTVKGCGWCSNTSSSSCEKCWTGYVLNVTSKQCDCAPGYAGTTSCTKCPANTISYGGKLPTAACTACPAGRVPNKNQTECVVAGAWDHWGYDLTNRRWGYNEATINVTNVRNLKSKWNFTAGLDITATPTVVDGRLYFPDWVGNLWCLDADSAVLIWRKNISELIAQFDPSPYPAAPATSIISRASPAVVGDVMVVPVMKKGGGWPYLLVLKTADGSLVWGKRVDPHPAAMLTQSPTVHNNYIYQGVSSLEELWATNANYPCCTFRGNMLKVDLATGDIIWRTYMTPDNGGKTGGFSGNSIWGSSPAIDVLRNQVYIATGNNYEIPEDLTECLKALGPLTVDNVAAAMACEATYGQGNYHNSMLALDMTTGAIRWIKQLGGPDAWNGACGYKGTNPNCAKPGLLDLNSPDYDFGQAPMLVTACKAGFCKQLVVAGQKSGWLWALSPDTGDVHWSTPVGPGGTVGGLQWGSAADTARIYVANNNYLSVVTDLTNMKPVVNFDTTTNQLPPNSTDGGLAAAIDAYDGTILWTFANPTVHWADAQSGALSPRRARSQAPMTVANDVVFYPSMDLDGTLFMLDARTGKLLSSFKTGMTTGCGPSVVNGKVYVGSGYANFGLGLAGNKLHMLSL